MSLQHFGRKGDKYIDARSNENIITNKKYSLSGRIGISGIYLNVNTTQYNNPIEGDVTKTTKDTVFVLGVNPSGEQAMSEFFNGKIYSVRLYNRILSDEEVKYNYEIDKVRFRIE